MMNGIGKIKWKKREYQAFRTPGYQGASSSDFTLAIGYPDILFSGAEFIVPDVF
jgi:hypothetical protein